MGVEFVVLRTTACSLCDISDALCDISDALLIDRP